MTSRSLAFTLLSVWLVLVSAGAILSPSATLDAAERPVTEDSRS